MTYVRTYIGPYIETYIGQLCGVSVSLKEIAISTSRCIRPFCVPPARSKEAREDAERVTYIIFDFYIAKCGSDFHACLEAEFRFILDFLSRENVDWACF